MFTHRSQSWKNKKIEGCPPPGNFKDMVVPLNVRNNRQWGKTLDVGCRYAWLAHLADDYTGVDNESEVVSFAHSYWANKWGSEEAKKRILLANIEDTKFTEKSFDTIVFKDVLEHLDNPIEVMAKVIPYLKPGGFIFISCPDSQSWVWIDPTHKRPFPKKAQLWLAEIFELNVISQNYESVLPGTQHIARLFKGRTPFFLRWLALLPFVPRNCISIFQKPASIVA